MNSSHVITSQDLHECIFDLVRTFQAQAIGALGSEIGLGGIPFGSCVIETKRNAFGGCFTEPEDSTYSSSIDFDTQMADPVDYANRSQWVAPFADDIPPRFRPDAPVVVDHVPIEVEEGPGIILWENAKEVLEGVANQLLKDSVAWLDKKLEQKIEEAKRGGYRYFSMKKIVSKIIRAATQRAGDKAITRLLSKKRPASGVRPVSSRIEHKIGKGERLRLPMLRLNVGRPPLPRAEWMRRYKARRARTKKTERTRRDKRKPMKAPPLKLNRRRPSRIIDLREFYANPSAFLMPEPEPPEPITIPDEQ